jgi:3-oxo-4,17-pregnadiene-20-carboxyl-CoA hydratase alpha subunit
VSATAAPPAGSLTLAEFFDGVRAGRVVVQRCGSCRECAVPPRAFCAACHGHAWTRVTLGGEGEVTSYTVIRVPPGSLAGQAPYAIVVVRFPEGVALLGRTTGIPLEGLRVDLPVRIAPPAAGADPPVITFAPRA